jgi:hypothetical protein
MAPKKSAQKTDQKSEQKSKTPIPSEQYKLPFSNVDYSIGMFLNTYFLFSSLCDWEAVHWSTNKNLHFYEQYVSFRQSNTFLIYWDTFTLIFIPLGLIMNSKNTYEIFTKKVKINKYNNINQRYVEIVFL